MGESLELKENNDNDDKQLGWREWGKEYEENMSK